MAAPAPVRRLPTRDLALIALFAALIAVLGLPGSIALFGSTVPITAQSLGPMLAGSILGARRGLLATLTFCALVLAGLPLLAGGRGGLGVLAGASAGYFVGFPLGAWVTGWLTERLLPRYSIPAGLVANIVGGIVVVYAVGVPVQAWRSGTTGLVATLVAATVFLPGDLIKAVIATLVARGVHAGYPTLGSAEAGGPAAEPDGPGGEPADPAGGKPSGSKRRARR
ncbi:biotin transporter BioY [Actinopolymorpha singaporensis]|uniref:Biotin transport system substrate-specific component n=1 Tax=Actinopolymorpha singaporensis TaxID=117157 RepID=A0A1H1XJW3_9ACTN|nr:biotin transporter BioY [Actinopolymorpha singaporensis]SDT09517.1 biotin transport system substrate-specific component [Actinopolymorpha singaporensis]